METGRVNQILSAITRNAEVYPLLEEAIHRLLRAKSKTARGVSSAIAEFETYANEVALLNPETHPKEYQVALDLFNSLAPLPPVEEPAVRPAVVGLPRSVYLTHFLT